MSTIDELRNAVERAGRYLAGKQVDDGHWPGDYGGPLFLLPGLVISCHITGVAFSEEQRSGMIRYLRNVQNEDGGFGLHIESHSFVFGTALNYVALRLLGMSKDDQCLVKARAWLEVHGGAIGIPSWGKFWLAVMNLYSWEGLNPVPPELWLLPKSFPLHPSRLWCHTRVIYLPMSFLFAKRFQTPETELIRELRKEIFVERFETIDWKAQREHVATTDRYRTHSWLLKKFHRLMDQYERRKSSGLRKRAMKEVMAQVHHEDESTSYLDLGPVNKAVNMLAVWVEDPESEAFKKHVTRINDYLWEADDGIKMQGYNGSQFWDVSFTMQALLEAEKISKGYDDVLRKAHEFLDRNQVRENVDEMKRYYRDPIKGAWPFSTAEQAWPVTDATGEGLKTALKMIERVAKPIVGARLADAADFILQYQNPDGGWSEYERARGGKWLELLNPAEMFGEIMIAYSYVECTSACVQGLMAFQARYPEYRRAEIKRAVKRGLEYLLSAQRDDGSFYGCWGICFTYATWFAVEAFTQVLEESQEAYGVSARRVARARDRACEFLLGKQRNDGGWGESYLSCVENRWVDHQDSQVVNTAWALLALMKAGRRDEAVKRGVKLLMDRQQSDGSWKQEAISGVFNRNCMIHYDAYRNVFPLWALARYSSEN